MDKFVLVGFNLMLLVVFLLSVYGFGSTLIKQNRDVIEIDGDRNFLSLAVLVLGYGIVIVCLQGLGILGWMSRLNIGILIFIGLLLALRNIFKNIDISGFTVRLHKCRQYVETSPVKSSLILLMLVNLTLQPLYPPNAWDEVMYHLPHAREWANSGSLTINEWLRYPYFPYNFNLLYAASLVFELELLTHLIHASSAVLVILGIYQLSSQFFGRQVAFLAVILFFVSVGNLYRTAYIELGLPLFIFFGFSSIYLAWFRKNFNYLLLGTFFIGLAVGVKYQALLYIPAFLFVILLQERRFTKIAVLALIFLLPCAYWYVRNYILVGNPVEPLAGSIFGYHSWNVSDMQIQMADIRRVKDWPDILVWPALITLLLFRRLGHAARTALFFIAYGLLVWFFTSHYSRYLIPLYPFMSILSAIGIAALFDALKDFAIRKRWGRNFKVIQDQKLRYILASLIAISALVVLAPKYWGKIQVTENEKAIFLRDKIYSYDVSRFLHDNPKYKVVQFGLESDLYYLPSGTIGDVFGAGRYQDFMHLESKELAKKIEAFGANSLLISHKRGGEVITSKPSFNEYFSLIKKTDNAEIYSLREIR